LLDFYDVEWLYEPHEYPVEWDDEAQPTKFFRPDFFLPGENVYIEITTMNQKLVTKKNKKVRKFRELYPGTHIKIFYQRDYLNLLVKYGLAPAQRDDEMVAPTRIPGPPHVIDLGDDGVQDAAG
jgi:hypoxanthine phosphoribosyltransferase